MFVLIYCNTNNIMWYVVNVVKLVFVMGLIAITQFCTFILSLNIKSRPIPREMNFWLLKTCQKTVGDN